MSRNKAKSKVRTAKGRKTSSTNWLRRQLNDPYINAAEKAGYRSRAAFKLKEIDEKLNILKPGMVVVDLGAAPGGWCQIAIEKKCTKIIAIDLLEMDDFAEVDFVQMDFMDNDAPDHLKSMLGDDHKAGVDLVMSDLAPNTTGHKQTDHLRIMAVVEAAWYFAAEVLKPGGIFIAKVRQGGAQNTLLADMKPHFDIIRHMKPPSSRKESSEQFLIASGFKP